jgi:hypothetical protein
MKCQASQVFNTPVCNEDAAANIDVNGSKGSVNIDICKGHLDEVMSKLPTQESEYAKRQRQQYS